MKWVGVRWGAAVAALLMGSISSTMAMQFRRVPVDGDAVILDARGPIIEHDFDRLAAVVSKLPASDKILGLSLDSPGGNVLEAAKIADLVRQINLTTFVGSDSECVSSCFLIFASGRRRVVEPDALVGVHSASSNGRETVTAMATTTVMARAAAELGVPTIIIGKMVQTPPGRMAWLTPEDLSLLGVVVLRPRTAQSPSNAPSQPPVGTSPAPVGTVSPTMPTPNAAFQQGLSDRRNWEAWFTGLSGAYREGAEYWAARRSTPNPGSCAGNMMSAEWVGGCTAAQARLAPVDVRRKTEPDYRLGWNSF